MKTIGLCMIVKNESHVITRCLDSVKRLLDYVLIVDTGSDDDTITVINNWLTQNFIPGKVLSEPWKNFAHNRSFALSELNKIEIDYALMIDADEILVFDDDFDVFKFKSSLEHDIYDITTNLGGFTYLRPTLTTNKKDCRYDGVVHEFLVMDGSKSRGQASGFFNRPIQDSARNKSGNKFEKDVILLEEALQGDISDWFRSRYTFYLAQSYRDSGNREKSLENYLKRADQGFWPEEVYMSLYSAGNLMRELDYPKEQFLQIWMRATEATPYRAEALYQIVQYCRIHGLNQQGYIVGKHALNLTIPQSSLFVETWIYDYALLDEFSICSFWAGDYKASKEACERLLSEMKMPEYYLDRVKSNLQFAIDRLN
jgi:glycosyltransferase involved in cell wall biosynthesis